MTSSGERDRRGLRRVVQRAAGHHERRGEPSVRPIRHGDGPGAADPEHRAEPAGGTGSTRGTTGAATGSTLVRPRGRDRARRPPRPRSARTGPVVPGGSSAPGSRARDGAVAGTGRVPLGPGADPRLARAPSPRGDARGARGHRRRRSRTPARGARRRLAAGRVSCAARGGRRCLGRRRRRAGHRREADPPSPACVRRRAGRGRRRGARELGAHQGGRGEKPLEDDIPATLPALARASKVQRRAAGWGSSGVRSARRSRR